MEVTKYESSNTLLWFTKVYAIESLLPAFRDDP